MHGVSKFFARMWIILVLFHGVKSKVLSVCCVDELLTTASSSSWTFPGAAQKSADLLPRVSLLTTVDYAHYEKQPALH